MADPVMDDFKSLKSLFVLGLILVIALNSLLIPIDVQAQSELPEPEPGDYFALEFFMGSIMGALVGTVADSLYIGYVCQDVINLERCREYAVATILSVYMPFASHFVGSTAGVIVTGKLNKVDGNYLAATIGTLSGSLAGIVVQKPIFDLLKWTFQADRLTELEQNPNTPGFVLQLYPRIVAFFSENEQVIEEVTLTLIPPIVAAFFGSIGYNIGATISGQE